MHNLHDEISAWQIEAERKRIAWRYERITKGLGATLAKIRKNPAAMASIKRLKKEGFRDWHILQAIENIVIALYAKKHDAFEIIEDFAQLSAEEAFRKLGEIEKEIAPREDDLSYEMLQSNIVMALLADATWDGQKIDKEILSSGDEELIRFLWQKHPYLFELDCEHEKVFDDC